MRTSPIAAASTAIPVAVHGDVVTEPVVQRPGRYGRQRQPHEEHAAVARVREGELPAARVKGGRVAGQAACATGLPVSAARTAPSAACWAGAQLAWNVESEVWYRMSCAP